MFSKDKTMERLHNSYDNLHLWRIEKDSSEMTQIYFDGKLARNTAIVLSILCFSLALFCWAKGPSKWIEIILWSSLLVGFFVPLAIAIWINIEQKKGKLLIYDSKNDCLIFPRYSLEINDAKKRVVFSFEHYTDLSDHFFELNFLIDGERKAFISSSVANGFNKIISELERLNFFVNRQKIRMD